MVVVLAELLHPEQAVHLAGLLLAVQHVILAVADGQLLVGMQRAPVGHHGVGAVHRLGAHGVVQVAVEHRRALLQLHRGGLLQAVHGVVQHAGDFGVGGHEALQPGHHEHVVLVVGPVAGDDPQLLLVDQRRGDFGVAVLRLELAGIGQQGLVQLPAPGQPVGHTGGGLVEHEQVQLLADLLVVPLLGFLDHVEVGLQLLLVREGVDIDALQGIPLLVAAPVGAGHGADLVGHAQQLRGIFHVGAAAQVHEVVAGVVHGDGLALGQVVDELFLIFLALEDMKRLFLAHHLAGPGLLAFHDLLHLLLDGGEVLGADAPGQQEIVIHAVGDLRADGDLHILPAEDFHHGLGQYVGQRVAVDFKKLFAIHINAPL